MGHLFPGGRVANRLVHVADIRLGIAEETAELEVAPSSVTTVVDDITTATGNRRPWRAGSDGALIAVVLGQEITVADVAKSSIDLLTNGLLVS